APPPRIAAHRRMRIARRSRVAEKRRLRLASRGRRRCREEPRRLLVPGSKAPIRSAGSTRSGRSLIGRLARCRPGGASIALRAPFARHPPAAACGLCRKLWRAFGTLWIAPRTARNRHGQAMLLLSSERRGESDDG